MLEKQEKQKQFKEEGLKEDESQMFEKIVAGFIDSIPEKGPLYDKNERRNQIVRAIAFGQLYDQLRVISDKPEYLTREQKIAIIKRIETLKREAYYWTKQSDSGRNFEQEIDEMSKSLWQK